MQILYPHQAYWIRNSKETPQQAVLYQALQGIRTHAKGWELLARWIKWNLFFCPSGLLVIYSRLSIQFCWYLVCTSSLLGIYSCPLTSPNLSNFVLHSRFFIYWQYQGIRCSLYMKENHLWPRHILLYAKMLKTGKDFCMKHSCINYPLLGNKLPSKLEA